MKIKSLLLAVVSCGLLAPVSLAQKRLDFPTHKKHVAYTAPAKAVAVVPEKTAYAWATRDRGGVERGIVSFVLNNPSKLTSLFPLPNLAYAGCFANGAYFFDRYRTYTDDKGESTWAHIALSTVDLATGSVTDIKDWSDEYFIINDMAYDYTTGLIYAMGRSIYQDDFLSSLVFEYSCLYTINPVTGVMTEVKQFIDWGTGTLANRTYYTMACDLNGTLYTIDQNGALVAFDRDNGYAEKVIGPTGLSPAHTTQSMEFDHTTGTLYWAADFSSEVSKLYTVDTSNGRAALVGETGTDSHLVGLYIPFEVPSQAAPGAVGDFVVTPDASGACKATISFTTPVKSFGGQTLASVSSVKLLRNDAVAATFDNPGPGVPLQYTDEVDAAGLYSYTVIAVNAAGDGLASGISRWVGRDVPAKVTNLGVGRTDKGYGYLCWDAPVEGVHGGVIDAASLGYRITRFPDGVVVASDCRETEFTDVTVPGVGRYDYTVESHTADGVGDYAVSMEISLGDGINSFPWSTLFVDESEFNLWTVVDCNGGSTWKWKARTAGGYESQAMYEYDNANNGDDYLISPALHLIKGARYRVRFAYAGANAHHTEKLEVTFGNGRTAQSQTQVIKSLTMNDGEFRTCEIDLPEVDATGYYHFAFHAISDAKQFNIYVTDVKVDMTVAPPSAGGDDDYEFTAPAYVRVTPDHANQSALIEWSMTPVSSETPVSDDIYEDFESMNRWEINPAGSVGWTYVDGDKGKPYVDDYTDNAYPNDGAPLAAMVMAPYDVHEYVYKPNPPHSGQQYLLFKSNYAAGDGSRPAPAPDDWLISPLLGYTSDFIFRFYCKADPDAESWDPSNKWNTERFHVGYSITDNAPESFIWLTEEPEKVTTSFDEWVKKEYSVPANARYVCIHYCTPSSGYWFMVDDIFIGAAASSSSVAHKSESLLRADVKTPNFSHFDVYVDEAKIASTTDNSYLHTGIPAGSHVAKVVAVYDEGASVPAVARFDMGVGSIGTVNADADSGDDVRYYNLQGMPVAPSAITSGIYIRKQGSMTTKVRIP